MFLCLIGFFFFFAKIFYCYVPKSSELKCFIKGLKGVLLISDPHEGE